MDPILGHAAVLDLLTRSIERPAAGYLFYGPDGVGKRLVARWFSSQLLASNFQLLASHPDFILLNRGEGEKNIKVEAVRELVARMHLTSAVGGRKIAVVEDAETMNEQGMNALLKGVEEPEGEATFIFVTEQPDRLPATLRSRLVSIRFSPLSMAEMKNGLEASDEILEASRGCPGIVKRILADVEGWQRLHRQAESLLKCFANDRDGRQVGEIERVAKTLQSAEDPARAWHAFLSECERQAPAILSGDPARLMRFGEAMIRARYAAGGPVSPALALEWGVVGPYHRGDVPTFLHPTYL
ncbi:MAG: DNA polymerase III subunit [Candidatus Uhrbacteria bacterium]